MKKKSSRIHHWQSSYQSYVIIKIRRKVVRNFITFVRQSWASPPLGGVVSKQARRTRWKKEKARDRSKSKSKSREEKRERISLPIQFKAKPKTNQIKSSSPNIPSSLKTGSNSHMQETRPVITSHKLVSIHLCTAHHQDHISSAAFHVMEEDRSAAPLEKQNKTQKCQKSKR